MTAAASWFYVDRSGEQRGPLSREALIQIIATERLGPTTLVWRDGLAQWQPLSSQSGELGHAPAPPPMTPPPPSPGPASSSFHTTAATPVVYAGFIRRFAALLLDNLVIGTICFVLVIIVLFTTGMTTAEADEEDIIWALLYYPLALVVSLLYWSLQESSAHQATLGKRALGIKVTDLDGQRLSWGRALGRWFAASLSYLTFYIGFLMAAFTRHKQALHDKVANTLVVDRWAYSDQPERQKQETSGCLIAVVIGVFLIVPIIATLTAIAIPAYQGYTFRVQIQQTLNETMAVQALIDDAWSANHECPINGGNGIKDEADYAGPLVGKITVGTLKGSTHCVMQVTLRKPGQPQLHGKMIWLELPNDTQPPGDWQCSSDVHDRYLPRRCRG